MTYVPREVRWHRLERTGTKLWLSGRDGGTKIVAFDFVYEFSVTGIEPRRHKAFQILRKKHNYQSPVVAFVVCDVIQCMREKMESE